jgi:hypothetical protein
VPTAAAHLHHGAHGAARAHGAGRAAVAVQHRAPVDRVALRRAAAFVSALSLACWLAKEGCDVRQDTQRARRHGDWHERQQRRIATHACRRGRGRGRGRDLLDDSLAVGAAGVVRGAGGRRRQLLARRDDRELNVAGARSEKSRTTDDAARAQRRTARLRMRRRRRRRCCCCSCCGTPAPAERAAAAGERGPPRTGSAPGRSSGCARRSRGQGSGRASTSAWSSGLACPAKGPVRALSAP